MSDVSRRPLSISSLRISDICKKDFLDVLGDLNVVVGLLTAIHVGWSSQWGTEPLALVLTGCKLFMAYFGQ